MKTKLAVILVALSLIGFAAAGATYWGSSSPDGWSWGD